MRYKKTIAIVSCSKQKKVTDVPIPAEQLYNSTLFKKALACAKSLKPDEVYILSAKYYLVELTDNCHTMICFFLNNLQPTVGNGPKLF